METPGTPGNSREEAESGAAGSHSAPAGTDAAQGPADAAVLTVSAVEEALRSRHRKIWLIISDASGEHIRSRAARRFAVGKKVLGIAGGGDALDATEAIALLQWCEARADKERRAAEFRASASGRVAAARWRLLRGALTGKGSEGDTAGGAGGGAGSSRGGRSVSVRRHPGFKLFDKKTRDATEAESGGAEEGQYVVDEYEVWPAPEWLSTVGAAHDPVSGGRTSGEAESAGFRALSLRVAVRRRSAAARLSLAELAPKQAAAGTSDAPNVDNTGNVCVWPAEEVLAAFLLRCLPRSVLARRTVCEIGAGMTGVAGLALAAAARPAAVVVTDGNADAAKNLEWCVGMNKPRTAASTAAAAPAGPYVAATQLVWDRSEVGRRSVAELCASVPATTDGGVFDIVVGADCLFFVDFHVDLVVTLARLLGAGDRVAASLLDGPPGRRSDLPAARIETKSWTAERASTSPQMRQAMLFAPRRGLSLARFVSVALSAGCFEVSVYDDYDETVSRQHTEFTGQSSEGDVAAYDPDIHYPLLVVLSVIAD